MKTLLKYLQNEHIDKMKTSLDLDNWVMKTVKGIPTQTNGHDCGIFLCTYAEYISANKNFNFNQKNIAYFRSQIICEIINNKLLSSLQ